MFEDAALNRTFEFYYLAELTRKRIKSLSRWEKPLHRKTRRWLKRQGLYVETIPRKLLNGRLVHETVFSTSSRYIDIYYKKFASTHLGQGKTHQKLEGFLFGYPSCCVNQFIEKPYIKNNFKKNDQTKLFHWACPHCRVTPELIPYYLAAYNATKEWYEQSTHLLESNTQHNPFWQSYKIPAAITSFLLSTGLLSAQTTVDSTHIIPLADDINQNNLSYAEEIWLGQFDQGILKESQTQARKMAGIIDSIPTFAPAFLSLYKVDHLMRGVFQCAQCDNLINMGYVTVINERRGLQIDLPYMALHFMKHGSFSWAGDLDSHFQRVDIDTLKRVIDPYDAIHMLPVAGDSDGDGLTDAEEDSLWINYTSDNPDFDGDGVPDGAQLAEELIRLFPKLKEHADGIHSHIKFNLFYGLENCQVCGTTHNMGTVTITNPENGKSSEIPIIALHSMAHGSFAYNGTVHKNERTNVIEFVRSIKTHMQFINDDDDNDGLKNYEEDEFGYNPHKADTNNNGICDGKELTLHYIDILKSLPTEPRLEGPYVEYAGMDGTHLCSVCGKEIVMGEYRIYNPLLNTPDPFKIREYAIHFMEHGSFAYTGAMEGRVDPKSLANYLGVVTNITNQIAPEAFVLRQNYPNPFNPITTISYSVGANHNLPLQQIELSIFNIMGQKVATLVNKKQAAGRYKVVWDASGLASGVYLYTLKAGNIYKQTRKLILLK